MLHHFVRDSGERCDKTRNRDFGIDERQKLVNDASAANAISSEFDETIGRRFGASRFDVNYNEVQVFKQSCMTVVFEQFDRVVFDDFEAPIVSDEIGYEQSGEFVVNVRKLENGIDDLRRSGASAGSR